MTAPNGSKALLTLGTKTGCTLADTEEEEEADGLELETATVFGFMLAADWAIEDQAIGAATGTETTGAWAVAGEERTGNSEEED
ncbi:hypothetical protein WICPIJ_008833 [Wickerhamomyces pijperi]|uniref:Uncharacterized protein n=1 Tax=Wickerhamomyces pijperi TaxID=599730 RepID=A0A9P8PVV6_WICPI|nr:hypothetical protein WICPIJ_008833 [Wickerhamomyces pijperi]